MSRPLAIVCDGAHERQARLLGDALAAMCLDISEVSAGGLAGFDLVVVANLRSIDTAEALRRLLGTREADSERYFVHDDIPPGRAWTVQADALGATRHVALPGALRTLRRARSVLSMPRSKPAGTDAAGRAMASAEQKIARLFGGFLDGAKLGMNDVAVAGRQVLDAVDASGGAACLEAVKNHHEGTFQHCLLVAGVAAIYARGAELPEGMALALMSAAVLHDIGKAAVPLYLLEKPGRLTDDEFAIVQGHPMQAHEYLMRNSQIPAPILHAVRHHHEALDGSGYPDGLVGEAIVPLTRILTVCDVYAALIERRAYKEEKSPEQAISILVDMALRSKVDYAVVHKLAQAVGVSVPDDLSGLVGDLVQPRRHDG